MAAQGNAAALFTLTVLAASKEMENQATFLPGRWRQHSWLREKEGGHAVQPQNRGQK